MKKNDTRTYFQKYMLLCFLTMVFGYTTAQTSYVGANSTVYLNGSTLTNQVVMPDASATVNMTAGTTFTGTGFVDGTVNVLGAGTTIVPVGDGTTKSTVTMTTAADDEIATTYMASTPSGSMDASLSGYALSDAEYWTIIQTAGTSTDVAVTDLTNTATTYGGNSASGTPILVRRDDASSTWAAYDPATNPGFGEFAYAAATPLLGDSDGNGVVDVFDVITNQEYVLGNNPSPFVFVNADVDESGTVDVFDIIAIQDIILNGQPVKTGSIVKSNSVTAGENYFMLENLAIAPGTTDNVIVNLVNDDIIRAFQFDITLPAGFTLDYAAISGINEAASGYAIAASNPSGNLYRVLVYATASDRLPVNAGAILTVPVTADSTVADGDYTFPLSTVKISDSSGIDVTSTAPSDGTITVDSTLGVDALNVAEFKLYPNPVSIGASRINYNLPSNVQQLNVTMYDITGKVVKHYNNASVQAGQNSIAKPQVANGLYLLQFSFNNGEQTVTKRLIVK